MNNPVKTNDTIRTTAKWFLYPPPIENQFQKDDVVFIRTKSKKEIGRKGTVIQKEEIRATGNNGCKTEKFLIKIPITNTKQTKDSSDEKKDIDTTTSLFYTVAVRSNRLVPVLETSSSDTTNIVLTETTTKYRLLAASQLKKEDHILEIGCSNGECSLVIAKYGGSLVGIDVSTEMISQAKEKMSKTNDDDNTTYSKVQFHILDPFLQPQKVIQVSSLSSQLQNNNDDDVETKKKQPTVIFIDIGGNRDLTSVIRMLEWVKYSFTPRLIIIKSEEMVQSIKEECKSSDSSTKHQTIENESNPTNNDYNPMKRFKSSELRIHSSGRIENGEDWFQRQISKIGNNDTTNPMTKRKRFPHPQKAPLQLCPSDQKTPICRYHNYHKNGCYHHLEGKCPYDHNYCHWCLQKGHIAMQCPNP